MSQTRCTEVLELLKNITELVKSADVVGDLVILVCTNDKCACYSSNTENVLSIASYLELAKLNTLRHMKE